MLEKFGRVLRMDRVRTEEVRIKAGIEGSWRVE